MEMLNKRQPQSNEIESIVSGKLETISMRMVEIYRLLKVSRQQQNLSAWNTQIKHCATLDEVAARLKLVHEALEWDLNGKRAWELERGRKFDPALECGDG